MSELKLRRRTRLKRKQAVALRTELETNLPGATLWGDDDAVETAEYGEQHVILVNQVIHGVQSDNGPFLSVRGLLAYRPDARWVTVDMGAVKFVHNGADVMAPGITEADGDLQEGDWCWIRDEKNGQPLAVGICNVPGNAMAGGTGKAIKSVHHIGDKLWILDQE